MVVMNGSDLMRFWDKVFPEPNSGCWLWGGAMNSRGYGLFSMTRSGGKRVYRVHRLAYEAENGPIPVGLQIDHLCCVKLCVNPAHLEPVTNDENARRRWLGGYHKKRPRRRTHCPKGHPYEGSNIRVKSEKNGKRYQACRECLRAAEKRRRGGRLSAATPLPNTL